jgi:hypothetical protein
MSDAKCNRVLLVVVQESAAAAEAKSRQDAAAAAQKREQEEREARVSNGTGLRTQLLPIEAVDISSVCTSCCSILCCAVPSLG